MFLALLDPLLVVGMFMSHIQLFAGCFPPYDCTITPAVFEASRVENWNESSVGRMEISILTMEISIVKWKFLV